jgi:segregation and condensation protein B
MELSAIIPHIEALIFASEKPLTSLEIVELINNAFGFMEERISLDQVESCIDGIREKYQSEFYPFEVRESGGGWQFLTKKDFHKTLAQLNGERFLKRLSTAALETLAIIAYKQPITKGEIETIRGVNSDYSIQKLLEKELIVITGRNENMPGKPLVYGTSKNFMDYFGLNSTDDLPKIKEVLAEQLVEPTIINADHSKTADHEESLLSVDNNGDLILNKEGNESSPTDENPNDQDGKEPDTEQNGDKEI